ncbi:MAG: DUF4389 domain-containing protein [Candidatus Bipolaricaulota bacterium]
MENNNPEKPTILSIDYPQKKLDRLTTFFRPLVAIPILIIFSTLTGTHFFWEEGPWAWEWYMGTSFVVAPTALMIIFQQKYPRWWFDWNLNLARFATRIFSYMALLTDNYPSTDEEQGVHLNLHYPDVSSELNRWMPIVKWFLAIPHYLVLFFLNTAATMVIIMAWFSILFTGRYPKKLFNFVVEVFHWNLRIVAYAFLMITDEYPAFSFSGWGNPGSVEKGGQE